MGYCTGTLSSFGIPESLLSASTRSMSSITLELSDSTPFLLLYYLSAINIEDTLLRHRSPYGTYLLTTGMRAVTQSLNHSSSPACIQVLEEG